MVSQERYDIIRLIRKDRAGGLYHAEDTQLNRPVLLKRLYATPFRENTETSLSANSLDQLQGAFQELATLRHPSIRTMIDANLDTDGAYIVYEYSESKSLLHLLRETHLFSETEALSIARQILEALSFAHQKEHYHGELSLQSIELAPRPRGGWHAQIQDFGQNKISSILHDQSTSARHQNSLSSGDPIPIAPELWQGAAPSAHTDIYAFGHLIYTILAGGHPYAQLSQEEIALKNRRNLLPLLCDVSSTRLTISKWVHQCLEPNPNHRSSNVAEILANLNKLNCDNKPKLITSLSAPQSQQNTILSTLLKNPATIAKSQLSRHKYQPQQGQTPRIHFTPSQKIPIYIGITLLVICLSLKGKKWKLKQTNTQSHPNQELTLAPHSSQLPDSSASSPLQVKSQHHQISQKPLKHSTNIIAPSSQGIRQENTLLRQFSQYDSLYAHWHFSPEYFLGKNYYHRDPKTRFQLPHPPKFKDNTLSLQSDQPILLHPELARGMPRSTFTLEALALVTKPQAQGGIISCSEDSPDYKRGFYLGYDASGHATFKVSSSQSTTIIHSPDTPFYRPHWVHLIGVFNKETLHLYVNGNQIATAPHGHKMTMAKQLPDFTIGGYRDSDTQTTMQGQLQALAIYKKALNPKEIEELFTLRQRIHFQ